MKPLFISITFHFVLCTVIFFYEISPDKKNKEHMDIKIIEPEALQKKIKKQMKVSFKNNKKKTNKNKKKWKLKDFIPKSSIYKNFQIKKNLEPIEEKNNDYGWGDHSPREKALKILSTGSFTQQAAWIPFYEQVWKRINVRLTYPKLFYRMRIEGRVNVYLTLNYDGTLDLEQVDVKSDNLYLKTYVLSLILTSLKKPLNKNYWNKRHKGKIPLFLVFDFELVHEPFPVEESLSDIQKNSLYFYRKKEVSNWVNHKFDEIFTRYIPPVFPLPGGFYIDFVKAYKMLEYHMSDTKPETLKSKKLKLFHRFLKNQNKKEKRNKRTH